MNIENSVKVFGGELRQVTHDSDVLHCTMRFSIFLPPAALAGTTCPVVYWLSGLTCTDENFAQKAGAFRTASELGLILLIPDTSPRGEGVPDDPEGNYDLGLGAGFYVNATQAPWDKHYQMYDYIVQELPQLLNEHYPNNGKVSIMGHSMGGHGALVIGMRNAQRYTSISAFSPICHPMDCPWGQKAFSNYLGDNQDSWQQYDATWLMQQLDNKRQIPIRIEMGQADPFFQEQLKPYALLNAADESEHNIEFVAHEGYDHSYYFISTFIEAHLQFHHCHLTN